MLLTRAHACCEELECLRELVAESRVLEAEGETSCYRSSRSCPGLLRLQLQTCPTSQALGMAPPQAREGAALVAADAPESRVESLGPIWGLGFWEGAFGGSCGYLEVRRLYVG